MPYSTPAKRDSFLTFIYQQHHSDLLLYALGLCRRFQQSDMLADDLVQNVYLRCLQSWEMVQARYQELGARYLYRMLRNSLTDHYRKEESHQELNTFYSSLQPSEYEIPEGDNRLSLTTYFSEELLLHLSDMERKVLELQVLHDLAYEQIADRLGIPAATAGTHLRRAKLKLQKLIRPKN